MSYEEAADELENGNAKTEAANAQAERTFRQSPPPYKIIRGTDIDDLSETVIKNIVNGYSCLGRPFYVPEPTPTMMSITPVTNIVGSTGEYHGWVQAMVNKDMLF